MADNNLTFAAERSIRSASAGAAEEQTRAIAQVQAAYVMAKRFPRDEQRSLERILNSCRRFSLAEQALYAYPRGDTLVEGPSIRLAEAIAQAWGNMDFGIHEVAQRNGESEVEAFATDLETNVRRSAKFFAPHIRQTKKGQHKLTDPRDIYEMVANNGARRLRACILAIIPGDVIEQAEAEVKKTLQANSGPLKDRIDRMIKAFAALNVTQAMLEQHLGHAIANTTEPEIRRVTSAYNAIKDGFLSARDIFAMPAGPTAGSGAEEGGDPDAPPMPTADDDVEEKPDANALIGDSPMDALIQRTLAQAGLADDQVADLLASRYGGVVNTPDLTYAQARDFLEHLAKMPRRQPASIQDRESAAPKTEVESTEPAQSSDETAGASDQGFETDGERTIDAVQQKSLFTTGQRAGIGVAGVRKIMKDLAGVDRAELVKVKFYDVLMKRLGLGG